MHKLLQRQLEKHTDFADSIPEEWREFIDAVDRSYQQADADRALLEKSLELSSQELTEKNEQLERDILELEQTEKALRTSEAKYRALFENVPAGVYQTTPDSKIISANPALVRMLGYETEEELREMDIAQDLYMNPEERRLWQTEVESEGELLNTEVRLRRKDGQTVTALENSRVIYDERGVVSHYEGTLIDITERKRAEEALHKSEALFHSLIESLPQNIFSKDLEGRFIFANQNYCAVEGKSPADIVGKTDFELHPPQLAQQYRADDRYVIENEEVLEKVEIHQPLGGERFYVQIIKTPLYDSEGRVAGILGIFWDITESKRMEEALRESESRFRELFNGTPACCWTFDRDGVILDWNRACENLYGWTAEQAIGKTMYELMVKDENLTKTKEAIAAVFRGEVNEGLEFEDQCANGALCNVLTNHYPIKDAQGQIVMGICAELDITERKRAEKDLQESEARNRALLNAMPDLMLLNSKEGIYLDYHASSTQNLPLPSDDLLGKSVRDVLSAPLAEKLLRLFEQALQTGEPQTIEYKLPVAEGETHYFESRVVACGEDKVLSIVREISERKRAEAERERLLATLQRRNTQLRTAAAISTSAITVLDPNELMKHAVNLIQERFNFYYVGMFLTDESGEYAILRAGSGEAGQKMLAAGHKLTVGGKSMVGWCIAHAQARIALDVGKEAVRFDNPLLPDTRSEMALPLLSIERCIGAVTVQSDEEVAFSEEDIAVLQSMTDQLAIAIENARLFESEREQLRLAQTLQEVGKLLTTTMSLKEVYEHIFDLLARVVEYDSVSVQILEPGGGMYMAAGRGFPDMELAREVCHFDVWREKEREEFAEEWRQRKVMIISDTANSADWVVVPGTEYIRSWIGAALFVKGELVGILTVDSTTPNAYNEKVGETVIAFANQAAIAIENTRLHRQAWREVAERRRAEKALRKHAQRLQILQEIDRAILTAQSSAEIAEVARRGIEQLLPCEYTSISTLDFERGEGVVLATNIMGEKMYAGMKTAIMPELMNIAKELRQDKIYSVDDIRAVSQPTRIERGLLERGARSYMHIPLFYRGDMIGIISCVSSIPSAFTLEHKEIVREVASSLSVAIEQARLREQVEHHAAELEQRVAERTAQLRATNRELESFSYSVSHDLRAPLRAVDGFSQALEEDYADVVDDIGKDYLHRIRAASQRMSQLINDVLYLSRVTRLGMHLKQVNLSELAKDVVTELRLRDAEREVEFIIEDEVFAQADDRLLRIALENLLGNAWKFTSKHERARIEFGVTEQDGETVYFVRDDGAGFDMNYADKMFTAFQRLHRISEFEGTGIGLATVQRVIHRHGGRIWAEGAVEQGATFYFTLPAHQDEECNDS